MDITFKLYASLTDYLPPEHRNGNRMALQVPEGATIAQIIAPFALPMKMVHLVLINGHYVAPENHATRQLVANDVLAIWPPIAGG
jgi:sulfur carrier protein ThiS